MKLLLPTTFSPSLLRQAERVKILSDEITASLSHRMREKLNQQARNRLIVAFLSMEEDLVSAKQVVQLLQGKRQISPRLADKEVMNVKRLCRHLKHFDPLSLRDFKHAQAELLEGLEDHLGQWRKEQVVIRSKRKIYFKPPLPVDIPVQMRALFAYMRTNKRLSGLIKACVFHYAIQFLHPFTNGNGRMGRIWQHLLLLKTHPIFQYVLIGEIIYRNYAAYYRALDKSDADHNVEIFVHFCLRYILKELKSIRNKI